MATQTVVLTQRTAANAATAPLTTTLAPTKSSSSTRKPAVKPPFSVGDIRRAIPAHCWQHSYLKSYAYLAGDIILAATLFYISTYIDTIFTDKNLFNSQFLGFITRHLLWTMYWIAQGVVFTGIWVIGHECGHGGFSNNNLVNDITGLITHSFLMVPYFSWKISHRRHHSNTGNIERDEVFVPDVDYDRNVSTIPDETDNYSIDFLKQIQGVLTRCFWLTVMLTVGWPAYLVANVSSNKSYAPGWVSHYDPNSPIFKSSNVFGREPPGQAKLIIISDLALVLMAAGVWKFSAVYGLAAVVYYYVIPLMQNIMWLVIITYLQHTDHALPHYDSSEWDWLRGALATVDRDYGVLNYFFHHIGDTHIVHHMFHQMPFYHAEEATAAVIPVLKEYYTMDKTPIAKALWENFSECNTISPDPQHRGVYWFNKDEHGKKWYQ